MRFGLASCLLWPLFFPGLLGGCRGKTPATADTGSVEVEAIDADGDGYTVDGDDCDDHSALVHPGATETCDGVDNNCDGAVDEGVTSTFYADTDGDGFGDEGSSAEACSEPSGYVSVGNDCDDQDAASHPGAAERCDGIDNDCDETVDEEVQTTWYADADQDGYGALASAYDVCDPPPGYVANADDCDDTNDAARPGGLEVCDEADNDCNGAVDEGVTTTFYQDTDGDNYGVTDVTTDSCDPPTGYAASPGDCDDGARAISPSATEICNGADDDCDGTADEPDAAGAGTWYADADGDGYGGSSSVTACSAPSGHVSNSADCDDTNRSVSPVGVEVCGGRDEDCDGLTDDDDPGVTGSLTWYLDGDGDGYGGSSYRVVACVQPSGFVSGAGDCDDGRDDVSPGESEVCDEADNDCDGTVDEGVTGSWYLDYDGDGYGAGSAVSACSAPTARYVSDDGDCDDTDTASAPDATPGCDGGDYDCDGQMDSDADGDGYPDITCGGSDCDDADAALVPEVGGGCALGESCLDVLDQGYSIGDGEYVIDVDGYGVGADPQAVWCDMTTDGGGWMRIADADYSVDTCPDEWDQDATQGVCYRNTARGSASSAWFSAEGVEYTEVWGSLVAYQYASTNAFWYASGRTVEDQYVDGVSVTVGEAGSREHVYTYAVGYSDNVGYDYDCPAIGGLAAPSFVGSDYTCDSGNSGTSFGYTWYSPALFSGTAFQVETAAATDSDVEVRILCDEESAAHSYSEDVGIAELVLYVR